MLGSVAGLKGFVIPAIDADIGPCKDFLFDDRHWAIREAASFGMAAGAAAVMTPGTELCGREYTERLYRQIIVKNMRHPREIKNAETLQNYADR